MQSTEVDNTTIPIAGIYDEVANPSVRATLNHQSEKPIEHYVKMFASNRIINPDKVKDVEDVIRAYWSLQDMSLCKEHKVNYMQQRITSLLTTNKNILKKLYYCKNFFTQQQIKLTNDFNSIVRFGKFHMFTSEYDANAHVPIAGITNAWGEVTGLANKQICIVIASEVADWKRSIVNIDDQRYINGIQALFGTLQTSPDFSIGTHTAPMIINKTPLFAEKAYSQRISAQKTSQEDTARGTVRDKFNVYVGNPFSEDDDIPFVESQTDMSGNNRQSRGRVKKRSDDASVHTGLVSNYGLIECYSFDKERYREIFEEYFSNGLIFLDDPVLPEYTMARMDKQYEFLLECMVNRAIMSVHQQMVDYLISVCENKMTIPQLMLHYSPGTMVKVRTSFNIDRYAMILSSTVVPDSAGELCLALNVLNPNITKDKNIIVHDSETVWFTLRSRATYSIGISPTSVRGGSVFNYYTPSTTASIMTDEEVDQQFAYGLASLELSIKPYHKYINNGYYNTEAIRKNGNLNDLIEYVPYSGRVMIDSYINRSPYMRVDKNAIVSEKTFEDVVSNLTIDNFKDTVIYPGGYTNENSKSTVVITGDDLYKDMRLILSMPVVLTSFIFDTKEYNSVRISDVEDVLYKEEAFSKLVLNEKVKNFIYTLSNNQDKNTFSDIIGGKESGAVFLLSGEAGTGKTLTAEAISEVLHKPLYQVSTGEFGGNNWEIEYTLDNIFKTAQRWGAIVLIDEADAYLAKRDKDIKRNAIISAFLRKIEYYKGVLFLTTNRADDIDHAFHTRIIQTFHFPNLDKPQREVIWKNLILQQGVEVTDKNLSELAKYEINGREIKNIIRAAIAISIDKNTPLDFEILSTTAALMRSESNEVGEFGNTKK